MDKEKAMEKIMNLLNEINQTILQQKMKKGGGNVAISTTK